MKLLGFIKEYNKITESISLDTLSYDQSLPITEVEKIIEYFNQGQLLLAWMGYVIDIKNKEPIAPDSYYTDGIWVWPSYLPYYLQKGYFSILDKEFIDYLRAKNYIFTIDESFSKMKSVLEKEFSKKLNEVV